MAVSDLNGAAPLPRTIDELMRTRANASPDIPVVSYPSSTTTNYVDYSLRQLDTFAFRVAQQYAHDFPPKESSSEKAAVIALLGVSDFDYIVTMLALTKLGYTVLLMSPRISQPAYAHLLTTTGSKNLVFQSAFREKAAELQTRFPDLHVRESEIQSSYGYPVTDAVNTSMTPGLDLNKENHQIAWVFHSSGSTGLPKPIHITHKAALGNYRRNMDYLGLRSFLTLPVFHTHGISSLFRAFISGKTIRIYNAALPLTKQHLINCMEGHEAEIFCTVPYALKILHESSEGVELLRRFDLVTFGGAPCPDPLGDALTALGVKLVTIYGMGEAGPLMTSMRPDGDDAWTYLRPSAEAQKFLSFEDRGEGLYELICGEGWPSRVATNRPDGSYATRDLFVRHPTLNAWKYSGRIDDVIVLEKGEKANPLPIEGAVRQDELVEEAVVFGPGKPHFGIMIVLSPLATGLSEVEIIDRLSPLIESSQTLLPAYAKISRDMVLLLPPGTPYPRTDKGTVIRKAFYAHFSKEIDEAYTDKVSSTTRTLSESELREFIRSETQAVLYLKDTSSLPDDQDFFELGMDSLQASQLRAVLVQNVNTNGERLDLNIVFDYPSVGSLAHKVHSISLGSSPTTASSSVEDEMKSLIEKYGNFDQHVPRPRTSEGQYVVLTGATGSLGAHLLAKLAQLDDVKTIYCLVRATSDSEARKRVVRSLRERKLYHTLSVPQRRKIVSLSSNLALPGLGLDPERYEQIAGQITALYHCAWSVNFNLKLSSFEKESIAGMKNLIDLCLKSRGEKPARFAFSSSVGTVLRTTKKMVPEALPEGFSSTQPTGYAQSKLVSEHICVKAIAETGLPAYILRVGQIVGDTKHGVWNSSEAVPLMLQTSKTIGSLPTIDESLRWLPVDDVAQTMIEITTSDAAGSGFFNLLNPNTFHWTRDLLPYLSRAGLTFDELDPPSWLNVLRASDSDVTANPPVKLLEYLTSNYDTTAPRRTFEFETENAQRFSSTFRNVAAPDEELIGKIVRHFTSACWKTSSAQNGAPSPQTAVIVHGPDSTETDTLATELASQLDMPILRGDVSETAEGGLGTPIIIDAGPLTKGDRDRLRKELNCPTIFLMLQHGTPAESALTPDDEEVDVIPLDATVEHSELLEDAASWVRDFVEV